MTLRHPDRPLPRRWRGTPTKVLPALSLVPGHRVYVDCEGVVRGFAYLRGIRWRGERGTFTTEYGNGTIRRDQQVVVMEASP